MSDTFKNVHKPHFETFSIELKQSFRLLNLCPTCSPNKMACQTTPLRWHALARRSLAERGGFEPPVQFNPYDSLANCWFQPLTHLSRGLVIAKTDGKYRRTGQFYHAAAKPLLNDQSTIDHKKAPQVRGSFLRRGGQIRTDDLLVPNQARDRATLRPETLTRARRY